MHKIEFELNDSERAHLIDVFKVDIGASLNSLRVSNEPIHIADLASRMAITLRFLERLYDA